MDQPPTLIYGGFWRRFGAMIVDFFCLWPVYMPFTYYAAHVRLAGVWNFFPELAFSLFFHVYLVFRFGGTPGKLALGLRVRSVNGGPVTLRESILRHSVDFLLTALSLVALTWMSLRLTDGEFAGLPRSPKLGLLMPVAIQAYAPFWYSWIQVASQLWIWGELLVLLTNRRRRALHDFIGGTVVIRVQKT